MSTLSNTKTGAGMLAWIVGFMLLVFSLGFLGDYLDLIKLGFFSPRIEQVRYNVFKQSQSYNEGMLRELEETRLNYIKANPDQKLALRSIAIHDFEVYDVTKLPPDLQAFYYSLTQQVAQ